MSFETPCRHNFYFNCVQCRRSISTKAARNVRINLAIVTAAIRLAKNSKRAAAPTPKVQHHIRNEDLPEEAYTSTDRAGGKKWAG